MATKSSSSVSEWLTDDVPICMPISLPEHKEEKACQVAIANNPANAPPPQAIAAFALVGSSLNRVLSPPRLTLLTSRWWGSGGVHLSVGFMEEIGDTLRDKILSYMNRWDFCNVKFSWTQDLGSAQVRITRDRERGGGYASYVGTDILSIPQREPTMWLTEFTEDMPDSEFLRVIPHEAGHTLGWMHEHLLKGVIRNIDEKKCLRYFKTTQGWDARTTRAQVLTPLDPRLIKTTSKPDKMSSMCYHLPGSIMKDGKPVIGGTDITDSDREFALRMYPVRSEKAPIVMDRIVE